MNNSIQHQQLANWDERVTAADNKVQEYKEWAKTQETACNIERTDQHLSHCHTHNQPVPDVTATQCSAVELRKEIYSYFVNVLGYRTEIYDLFDHHSVTSLVENMKRDGEWLGFQEYRSK